MLLLAVVGCLFIDDAEHAAFLATLGGSSGSHDSGSDTSADSGDTALETEVRVSEIGSGLTSGGTGDGLGAVVLTADVTGLGPALLTSNSNESGAGRVWIAPLDTLAPGARTEFDSTTGTFTGSGSPDFGAALALVSRADAEVRLLASEPSASKVSAFGLRTVGTSNADGVLTGEAQGDAFGAALATWGQDPRLVGVGAPDNACGTAYVAPWPVDANETLDATRLFYGSQGRKFVPLSCEGATPIEFGAAIAVGDFLGTGLPGVVIGAPGEPDGSGSDEPAGGAYLLFDLYGAAHDGGVVDTNDLSRVGGEAPGGRFGAAALALDVDGDGREDAVISAPTVENGVRDAGSVYIFLSVDGPAEGAATDANVVLRSAVAGARFGTSLAGLAESGPTLAVGAPGWSDDAGAPGAVFLFPCTDLSSDEAFSVATRVRGEATLARFGASLAGSGVPSPGFVAGAPGAPAEGESGVGSAWWFALSP